MIHADGAVTLRLKETGRTESAVEGGRIVTVKLQDEHYPVYITRYVRTWNDCDAVETWYELCHEEPGRYGCSAPTASPRGLIARPTS